MTIDNLQKSSVTLQNNVRLRVFLILVLSIGIRILRPFTNTSVHKATGILEINYVLYGLIVICTLLPFKGAWVLAGFAVVIATLLDSVCTVLGIVATVRCLTGNQAGCIQSAPADITSLVLASLITLLDAFQTWCVYLVVRFPSFIASSTQRVRILFAWAWPFAWMVNIALVIEEKWTIWTVPHLFVDPTLIVLANLDEMFLLAGIMAFVLFTDLIALLHINLSLARLGVFASMILTGAGLLMLFVPDSSSDNDIPNEDAPVATKVEPVAVEAIRKEKSTTNNLFRRQKSRAENLTF